jgi:ribose transport system ATP-binding protein
MVMQELNPVPSLSVAENLFLNGLKRGTAVRDVSFDVREGEIFGISGLIGSGRTALLRLVFGADRASAARSR